MNIKISRNHVIEPIKIRLSSGELLDAISAIHKQCGQMEFHALMVAFAKINNLEWLKP